MEVVRRHSIATAHISQLVANSSSIPTDYAFLCGLLHDVGMAGVLLVLDELDTTLPDAAVADALSDLHPSASAVIGRAWSLPPDVQIVLAHHHEVIIGG